MKEISEEQQFKLISLIMKNETIKAYKLECEYNKQDFDVSECVDRLLKAEEAGKICYKNKSATPFWVKNYKYLEQSFSYGWKLEQSRDLI